MRFLKIMAISAVVIFAALVNAGELKIPKKGTLLVKKAAIEGRFVDSDTFKVTMQLEEYAFEVPIRSTSKFRIVEQPGLNGTYVRTIWKTNGTNSCTVYVPDHAVKLLWEYALRRYQPGSPDGTLPFSLVPTTTLTW